MGIDEWNAAYRDLIAGLTVAHNQRDETAALGAALSFLERIGVEHHLLDPLDAVFKLILTARSKKQYGNRSTPPHEVLARAMAAAEVIVLRKFEGLSEREALEKVATASGIEAKVIEGFIDSYQRGQLNRMAVTYLERCIDHVILRSVPPERRAELLEYMQQAKAAALKAGM